MHAPTATQDPPLPTVTTAMPAPRVSTITDREELPKARKVGSAICGVYSCAASVSSVISMIPPPPPAPKQQIISSLLQLSHSDCLGSFPFCSTTITISLLVMCPATTAVSAVQVWLLLSKVPRWACTEMPYQEQFYIQKIQEPAPPPLSCVHLHKRAFYQHFDEHFNNLSFERSKPTQRQRGRKGLVLFSAEEVYKAPRHHLRHHSLCYHWKFSTL